jgi:hypothetical protein
MHGYLIGKYLPNSFRLYASWFPSQNFIDFTIFEQIWAIPLKIAQSQGIKRNKTALSSNSGKVGVFVRLYKEFHLLFWRILGNGLSFFIFDQDYIWRMVLMSE